MDTKACVCGASAMQLYRSSRRLIPTLLDKPRTGQLTGCIIPAEQMLADEMERNGIHERPHHLLVNRSYRGYKRDDIVVHIANNALPPRALIKASRSLYVTSPELTFIQIAASGELDEMELALIGFELCGTYVLDDSWDGCTHTDTPLTSVLKISRMIDALPGYAGVERAHKALTHVADGSNSPMESVLAMLVSLPTRMGGLGLGPIALNHPVATPLGPRRPDILFTKHRVGLEYKGKEYHSVEAVGRDDRRQNKLTGSGVTILNVWYEDLVNEHLFEQFITDLFRTLSMRKRIRVKGFVEKQALLRARLMPAIERFG